MCVHVGPVSTFGEKERDAAKGVLFARFVDGKPHGGASRDIIGSYLAVSGRGKLFCHRSGTDASTVGCHMALREVNGTCIGVVIYRHVPASGSVRKRHEAFTEVPLLAILKVQRMHPTSTSSVPRANLPPGACT